MVFAGTASHPGRRSTTRYRPSSPAPSQSSFPERLRASSIPAIQGFPIRSLQSATTASRRAWVWRGLLRPNQAAFWENTGHSRNDQHPRQLRQLLYLDSAALYRSAGRQCSLWHNLYKSAPPLFATPFITAANGQNNGQPFPYTFAPLNSSRSNPDPNIDWSTYEPIEGIPGYDIHNTTPYTEEWMLSIERQAGPKTVFSASYVGTSSHRQRVLIEPNPGNPALCLSLSQPARCSRERSPAVPGGEDTVYYPIAGGQVNGTRGPLGPNFGSNALQSTIGHANYNALELSARHTSGRLEFFAAYTYGKSWISHRT